MFAKLTIENISQFLLDTDLFSTLTISELSEIEAIMDIQRYRAGELVFSEGDIGDAWYVLFDGCVQVSKHMPFEKDETVARLLSKACFGEMAILDSTPRSATIFALEDCTVFRFPRSKFERLLEEGRIGAYKLVRGMAVRLAQRQRLLNTQIAELTREIEAIESELDLDRTDIFSLELTGEEDLSAFTGTTIPPR